MALYFEDTHPEIEKIMVEKLRKWTAAEKLIQVASLIQAADQMALVGLRKRYPNATERELQLRLAALKLDRETMIKVFNWDPKEKGL